MDNCYNSNFLFVQVVRYSRGGSPLWISSQHIPSAQDVSPCACGASRTFEFQVVTGFLKLYSPETICFVVPSFVFF